MQRVVSAVQQIFLPMVVLSSLEPPPLVKTLAQMASLCRQAELTDVWPRMKRQKPCWKHTVWGRKAVEVGTKVLM